MHLPTQIITIKNIKAPTIIKTILKTDNPVSVVYYYGVKHLFGFLGLDWQSTPSSLLLLLLLSIVYSLLVQYYY